MVHAIKLIKQGITESNYIIAESDRYIPLNHLQPGEASLVAGKYLLTGELVWGENNQNKQKFNVNLTIPPSANSGQ